MKLQNLQEQIDSQFESINKICIGVEQFVESSNNAIDLLKTEMKRLKTAGSMENYKQVYAEYQESKKGIKDKASTLNKSIKSFESKIKKMPFSPIRARMTVELKKASKTLKTLKL